MEAQGNAWSRFFSHLKFLKIRREFWIFLTFVIISVAFWFLQVFKDQTNLNIEYGIELKDVPGSTIVTSSLPSSITVTIQGRGYSLLDYFLKHRNSTIYIDYADIPKVSGVLTIDNYVWKKAFAKEFGKGVSLISVNPSTIEVYTSSGAHKQVPVTFKGNIKTASQYLMCNISLDPQYIDIYAPVDRFDTVSAIMTEELSLTDLKDTTVVRVALNPSKGIKCVPDSVTATICVDLFTTKTVKVPIYCENIPEDRILRTFPLMAEVTFNVSATMYPNVTADDFVVTVDYTSIQPNDKKCKLKISGYPDGISNIKLNPEYLDYIIETDDN